MPFLVLGLVWEAVAYLGVFPSKLFPDLQTVAGTFVRLLQDGILVGHTLATVLRLLLACVLAGITGVGIGILMGRYGWAEDTLLPLVSIGSPIPGIGYAPLFILWFGLGNLPAVLLVALASFFPVVVNTWTGVRAVKRIWIHSAEAMGAHDYQLFQKVILPGALPYILTGCRLGFARAWRVLIAVEMLTSVPRGLGWLIFGAREFLSTDIMLAGIAVIGVTGVTLEKLVFEPLERFTVVRWGMLAA